jgi:hypothetical protein
VITGGNPRAILTWWFWSWRVLFKTRAIHVPLRAWFSSTTGPKYGHATTAKPGSSVLLGAWRLQTSRLPSPFCLSPSVMPFAGVKISHSLARAARWLPVRAEPSQQRDTDGDHQKKAYAKQEF